MSNKDYIPTRDSEFREWEAVLTVYLTIRYSQWGISEARWLNLTTLKSDYEAKYAIAENPATRTPVAVTEKKEAHARYVAALREIISAYITRNPDVTDGDRRAMGLPVHDRKPTPASDPATLVELEADFSKPQQLSFRFHDEGSASKAKPAGIHGAEFIYVISDTPVEDPNTPEETFNRSSFFTRTPAVFDFTAEQRGKFFCTRARWENTTGKKGLLSEILCVRIP
ncbi:MAG: hypothetical protein LBT78_05455 [Tannerella sp.]|jgi:hypothetical protein|nr:hypothetical protein [Tannerella sp.]